MTRLRLWVVAVCAWLFAFGNIERLHAPINVASFVYVLTFAVAVATVFWRPVTRWEPYWVSAALLALLLLLKYLLGYPLGGSHLPLTVTEGCAVVITLALGRQLARCIDEFERAAADALLIDFEARQIAFEHRQPEIHREMRRARQFARPLSLVTIGATKPSLRQSLARLIEEAQRKSASEYVSARIADLIARETDSCDLITRRNGHFLVLLPESGAPEAREILERLRDSIQQELGVEVRAGLATFPDQEVTFAGLLERAEAEMQSVEFDLATGDSIR